MSNNGYTGWRPTVSTIRVYSDQCSTETPTIYIDQSGSYSKETDGSKAFDDSSTTYWRPQCGTCNIGEAWVMFSTETNIQSAEAYGLGEGAGGEKRWNVGIRVETLDKGIWRTIFESNFGNIANGRHRIKPIYQS